MENDIKVDFEIGIDYENIKGKTIPESPEEIDALISSVISVKILDVHINETKVPEVEQLPHYNYDMDDCSVEIY